MDLHGLTLAVTPTHGMPPRAHPKATRDTRGIPFGGGYPSGGRGFHSGGYIELPFPRSSGAWEAIGSLLNHESAALRRTRIRKEDFNG